MAKRQNPYDENKNNKNVLFIFIIFLSSVVLDSPYFALFLFGILITLHQSSWSTRVKNRLIFLSYEKFRVLHGKNKAFSRLVNNF